MSSIVIAYCTGAGHTRRLAQDIAIGAGAGAALVDVETLTETDWPQFHTARAIVFGAPTYMGSAAAAFKTFMDASSDFWADQPWRDKIAAGFTVGSSPAGDKGNTLSELSVFAAQHGMIWVGQSEIGPPTRHFEAGEPVLNRDGFNLGLAATSSRDKSELIGADDLATARLFGARIAAATARWG